MLVAEQFPSHRQRLAVHGFRLCQPAVLLEHEAQVVERKRNLFIFNSVQLPVHPQSFAMHGFGLRQLALLAKWSAEIIEGARHGRMLIAK